MARVRFARDESARITSIPRSRRARPMLAPSRPAPTMRTGPRIRAFMRSSLGVVGGFGTGRVAGLRLLAAGLAREREQLAEFHPSEVADAARAEVSEVQ